MHTITLMERQGTDPLSFDLRNLLVLVAPAVRRMNWRICGLECVGERSDELHRLALHGDLVDGDLLMTLAAGIEQVIDGEFSGYEPGRAEPTLVFRAVDSSSWDISAESDAVLGVFRRCFSDVHDAGDQPV